MASHVILGGDGPEVHPPANVLAPAPSINLKGFHWTTVDEKLHPKALRKEEHLAPRPTEQQDSTLQIADLQKPQEEFVVGQTLAPAARAAAQATPLISAPLPLAPLKPAPPFPLTQLQGAFAGNGFNSIFRPRSDADTIFPASILSSLDLKDTINPNHPALPSDNILELNLTTEQLTFGETIGDIPNRGLAKQPDITNLEGFPYLQTIQDVTNPDTGKGDNPQADGIHFEPGMWLFVPANPSTPTQGNVATVARMASIPHGTTINAQGVAPPSKPITGPPDFTLSDLTHDTTPFLIGTPTQRFGFPSMKVDKSNVLRLPQNLANFKAAGTITDDIIKDPNLVLKNAIKGLNIVEHVTFEVSTGPPTATVSAGGTANIAFLQGGPPPTGVSAQAVAPNAQAAFMTFRFWIETVEYEVPVPKLTKKDSPVTLKPNMPKDSTAPTPTFLIMPPPNLPSAAQTVKLRGVQLQYSQTVNLNFGGLTWPHVSVATLVPKEPLPFTLTS